MHLDEVVGLILFKVIIIIQFYSQLLFQRAWHQAPRIVVWWKLARASTSHFDHVNFQIKISKTTPSCFTRFYRGLLMYVVAVQIHSAHSARPPFKSYAAWRDESSGFFGPFQRNSAHTGTPILSLTLREEPNKRAQRAPSPRPLVLLATPNSF